MVIEYETILGSELVGEPTRAEKSDGWGPLENKVEVEELIRNILDQPEIHAAEFLASLIKAFRHIVETVFIVYQVFLPKVHMQVLQGNVPADESLFDEEIIYFCPQIKHLDRVRRAEKPFIEDTWRS